MQMKPNKRNLVKKYGADAEKVMYGRATNLAKKLAEQDMEQNKLREMVKAALSQPVSEKKSFPDLTGDGKVTKADILKARGVELDEGLAQAVVLTDKDHENLMKNGSVAVNVGGQTIIVSLKNFDVDMEDYEDSSLEEIGMFHDPRGYDKNAASEDEKALQLIDAMIKKGVDKEIAIEKVADKFNLRTSYLQRKIGEGGLNEDLDLGHEDNEPHMLKGDLYRIGKYAMELYQMVDEFEGQGEVDFPHWWQAKIINSKDALVGAKHYLDFEVKEPSIDAMVDRIDDVAPEMEIDVVDDVKINEEEPGKADMVASDIQKALNKHKGDEAKTYQLQQARKAMNKGDLSKAEKIAKRLAEKLKTK